MKQAWEGLSRGNRAVRLRQLAGASEGDGREDAVNCPVPARGILGTREDEVSPDARVLSWRIRPHGSVETEVSGVAILLATTDSISSRHHAAEDMPMETDLSAIPFV